MDPKNILIVSFFYPPYERVGGRRWAKFVKYLNRNGYKVKVLCARLSSSVNSPWDDDIRPFEEDITRIPVMYKAPFFRRNMSPASLIGKLRYRISYTTYKRKIQAIKGDPNDLSIGYENIFIEKTEALIRTNNVTTLLLSGGPFRYISALMSLKKKYPEINFIVDFRDFWADNMTHLDAERRNYEYVLEKETISAADFIITPAERIKNLFIEKYPFKKDKIFVISHAYDKDDFPVVANKTTESNSLKLIYAGSLYAELNEEINALIALIKLLKVRVAEVKVDFYTFQKDYCELFEKESLQAVVRYHKPISNKDLFTRIATEYDAVIILLSGRAMTQHFKSSKYYELAYLRKPIIYIGPEGDVSAFTENQKLGFYADPRNLEVVADRVVLNTKTKEIPSFGFPIEDFSFEKVTRQLEKILS